jgi:hypothetical protein
MLKLFIVHGALLLTLAMFFLVAMPIRWWNRRARRRSPMTFRVRHLPGERLRTELAEIDEKGGELAMALVLAPPVGLAVIFSRHVDLAALRFGVFEGVIATVIVAVVVYVALRMNRIAERRRRLSDAMYAELATAQELTPLYAKDFQIMHNVTGDGFDIDHVVIGPSCVWTIESKSRRKPKDGGKDAAKVMFDGKALRFPDWVETRPVDQARAQARWLADYLRKRNGEAVEVRPVISLFGWYVERTAPSDVAVISTNGLGRNRMFDAAGTTPIDQKARVRICAALDERTGVHRTDATGDDSGGR